MNDLTIPTLLLGFFCGLIFLPIMRRVRSKPRIPTVLGCTVPLAAHQIDFSKRYKLYMAARFSDAPTKEFNGVRIIGYVQKEDRESGKFYSNWIVGELPDGRKLYLTPGSIQFMEEEQMERV